MEVSTVSAQKYILEHFDFQALEFWNRDPYPIVIVHRKYTSAHMIDTVELYCDKGEMAVIEQHVCMPVLTALVTLAFMSIRILPNASASLVLCLVDLLDGHLL